MIKISGLDTLTRNLADAQKAFEALNGELGTVSFNPDDPGGIEAAIQELERLVDERLAPYASNPIIGPMAEGLKQKYREGIIERAASARLEGDQK